MLHDPNLRYLNMRCHEYCSTVYCTDCKIGDALTAATGEHHRCGNGFSFNTSSMDRDEIFIAYHAISGEG